MKLFMERLIETAPVAFVGGSDLAKITWQLGEDLVNRSLYTFSENGCVVIHQGT